MNADQLGEKAPQLLIVEDERIVARSLHKQLEDLGYVVVGLATSGEDAIRQTEALRPDLVLMDIKLEGDMDGVDAAAQLRARFRIPVVFLTAYSNDDVLQRAKVTEPYGYVLKPYGERELHVVVETALYKRRAERQLEERDRWFAATLKSIGDGVITTDVEGRVTFMNPIAQHLTGWEWKEAAGRELESVFVIVHEKTRQTVENPLRQAMRERRSVPMANSTVLVGKDGAERPIDDCAAPIIDEQDNALGGVLVFRDMSERKRALEELRLRNRAIQAIQQGVVITDATKSDNPIVYATPGFERTTGYPVAEVLGRNCRLLQGPDTDREVVKELREALAAARPHAVEILNYRKDGTPFWNAMLISPVRDEAGNVTHFVGTQTDVTERRKLEQQYRQAQKMEAVGRLAGGIAHDFNNLLTVINGFSQVLMGLLHTHDKAKELVEEIAKAGERAAKLTQQLLAHSRQQMFQLKIVNLNDVVTNLKTMLTSMIGEDVAIATSLAADLRPVKVDPGQMEQVLMNLAVNARDAMPQGGKLSIETGNVDLDTSFFSDYVEAHPGPYVLLTVSDTGIGMSDEIKAHLFEPFFTTKAPGLGTGLGLATVYGIVKQSEGYMRVSSEVGIGTSFLVYLPAVAEEVAPTPRPSIAEELQKGTETVLLIEDEMALRALSRYILSMAGYAVLEAADGVEALEVSSRHQGPIHLLVTDVVMPRMGGRPVAEALRLVYPEIKVLYVSGYTDDAVVRHGISESQEAFLQKPFSMVTLAKKVRETLDHA